MEGSMSKQRQHRDIAHLYGLVVLKCRENHELGRVLKQKGGNLVPMKGPGWLSPNPLTAPLAMRCPKCQAAGRRQDLRGSWDKIRAQLAELEADPTRGPETYLLGG